MSEGRSCEEAFRSTDQHSLESFHKAMPLSQSPLLLPPAHSMLHVQQAIAMNLGQVSDMALPGWVAFSGSRAEEHIAVWLCCVFESHKI